MKKRLPFIAVCILVFALFLTGCGNQLSSEAKTYKKETYEKYIKRATALISGSLAEKYGDGVEIVSLDIVGNIDYSFGFSSEPYKEIATGKAQLNGKVFDIYLKWGIDDNPVNFICCDNFEKDIILQDLEEYFTDLYGQKPYATYYEVFSSLGYEFNSDAGMMREKYTGQIEDYLTDFDGLIRVAAAYENLDSLSSGRAVNSIGEIQNVASLPLMNARNVYIINTFENVLTEQNLKLIISRHKIEEFLPYIKEYIHYEKGIMKTWTNTMSNFAEFTYSGNITDKTVFVDESCGLILDNWENVVWEDIDKYRVVSDWYFNPENSGVFYIKESFLKEQCSKYTVMMCHKIGDEKAVYSYDVVSRSPSGYLMINPESANTWFAVCIHENDTVTVWDKLSELPKDIFKKISSFF